MRFVNKRMVLAINSMCVDLTGGTSIGQNNVRAGQSLSFVDNIFYNEIFGQELYPDIYHRAAAYMFHILKNHTFNDGNKRTGLACALTFLQWNNYYIDPLDEDSVFDFVISVAEGSGAPEEVIPRVAEWLQTITKS